MFTQELYFILREHTRSHTHTHIQMQFMHQILLLFVYTDDTQMIQHKLYVFIYSLLLENN